MNEAGVGNVGGVVGNGNGNANGDNDDENANSDDDNDDDDDDDDSDNPDEQRPMVEDVADDDDNYNNANNNAEQQQGQQGGAGGGFNNNFPQVLGRGVGGAQQVGAQVFNMGGAQVNVIHVAQQVGGGGNDG